MILANTLILTTTTAHLFIKALKMSQEKKYTPFCEALTLKYSSDVRHVNLFQAIKKISKTVLNIKTGNYYTNLGGWWKKLFKDFVSTLEGLNYIVNYQVVNVANYGVPQRRKRLILLASRRKEIKLIDATHQKHLTVRDAIGSLPRISAGEANENDRLHISPALSPINLERIQHSVPGGTWRDWPERLVLNCHKKEGGKTYASVYGRMKWDDLSPTITTQFIGYGTGRFGHPEQDRAITLREGAILQSFPPDYQFSPSNVEVPIRKIARHIGNAVPPRLGEVIGESIIRSLPKKRQKKATIANERERIQT